RTNTINMPAAANNGYVLAIDNSDAANVLVKIVSANAPSDVTLIAQSGGEIYFAGKSQPGKPTFTATIPKSKFPSGVIQFTLFSATGEPLNERIIYIQNPDQLKINLTTAKANYAPYDKV